MTFEDSKRYEQLLEEERVCLENIGSTVGALLFEGWRLKQEGVW